MSSDLVIQLGAKLDRFRPNGPLIAVLPRRTATLTAEDDIIEALDSRWRTITQIRSVGGAQL
jgi:hypothetical protein